ncbi:MAG TPA: porin, partial [Thiotrichales bacterium]|nr:porin [Thiotrichales bacterium]
VGAALGVAPLFTAEAGVKWYGQLQMEVSSESLDITGKAFDGVVVQKLGNYDGVTVDDNKRGRLGVKVSEDLGNGLKALAKFEWQVDTSDADAYDGSRESYVGLTGGWGTFLAGSLKSPYKYTGGVKYDPFVTTQLEARRYGGMSTGTLGHNAFINDAVAYASPNMNGFNVIVGYVFDESINTGVGAPIDGSLVASAKYGTKAWEVFVAGAYGDNGVDGYDATKFGGKFKFGGGHEVVAQYEIIDAMGTDESILFAGYHYTMGKTMFVAQMGLGTAELADDQDSTYFAIGAVHKLSKKTRVFGGYRSTSVDNAAGTTGNDYDGSALSLGLRVDF